MSANIALTQQQEFQSTHPRRVRLSANIALTQQQEFQSTHPRRVRQVGGLTGGWLLCFNPRTHVGCDSSIGLMFILDLSFNPRTHVGCDLQIQNTFDLQSMFQSTHPRRVRLSILILILRFSRFQSTHPRRVRPLTTLGSIIIVCFNPRTHVGCDKTWLTGVEEYSLVSIHAPT